MKRKPRFSFYGPKLCYSQLRQWERATERARHTLDRMMADMNTRQRRHFQKLMAANDQTDTLIANGKYRSTRKRRKRRR